jgi:hypothetical protein
MPIEFRCSECGKLLRTGDDTVGRQAQCPECGAISSVPSASVPSDAPVPPLSPLGGADPFGGQAGSAESTDNPYQSPAPAAYIPPGFDALVAERVSGPATALIVTGILGVIAQIVGIVANLARAGLGPGMQHGPVDIAPILIGGGLGAVAAVFKIIVAAVILIGAMKMKKLESYGLAMAAAIIAMVPCISPCCLLGLPFGIWALVVLSDGNVKAAFRS